METNTLAAAAATVAAESHKLPFNWFDLVVLVLLGWGIYRGRKRGMSEELLSLMQVLTMLVVGGLYYQPVGDYVASVAQTDTLYAYLLVYVLILGANALIFLVIKRVVGEKLVGSDLFGRMEYYLGMLSGMIRYAGCVLIALALLNAPVYTKAEAKGQVDKQNESLGRAFFVTPAQVQEMVLHESLSGSFAQRHLESVLIKPTPNHPAAAHETPKERREREVNKAYSK